MTAQDKIKDKIQDAVGWLDKADKNIGDYLDRSMSFNSSIADTGRAFLSALYPNDFEYYIMAMEVVDSKGDTYMYMVFPVSPSSYEENKPHIPNIKKTFGGVSISDTDAFIPIPINIAGNFGRRLKVILGNNIEAMNNFVAGFSFGSAAKIGGKKVFSFKRAMKRNYQFAGKMVADSKVKTGYGAFKLLEMLCDADGDLDMYGKPYRVYLYNPAVGSNYLVKVLNFGKIQNMQTNTIWNYNMQLIAIAPLEYVIGSDDAKKDNKRVITNTFIQKRANDLLNIIRSKIPS